MTRTNTRAPRLSEKGEALTTDIGTVQVTSVLAVQCVVSAAQAPGVALSTSTLYERIAAPPLAGATHEITIAPDPGSIVVDGAAG